MPHQLHGHDLLTASDFVIDTSTMSIIVNVVSICPIVSLSVFSSVFFRVFFCRKWFPVTVIFILVVASKTYVLLLMLWMHKYTVAIFLQYHSFMLVSDTCILFLLLTRGSFLAIWEQLAFEGWIQKFAKETGTGWSVSCEF